MCLVSSKPSVRCSRTLLGPEVIKTYVADHPTRSKKHKEKYRSDTINRNTRSANTFRHKIQIKVCDKSLVWRHQSLKTKTDIIIYFFSTHSTLSPTGLRGTTTWINQGLASTGMRSFGLLSVLNETVVKAQEEGC